MFKWAVLEKNSLSSFDSLTLATVYVENDYNSDWTAFSHEDVMTVYV